MTARPFVLLSVAMSIDGCIDDTSPDRLVLSDAADLDRVDEVRAGVDAILVGATTLRRDNPRLLVRSEERRAARVAQGRPVDLVKVVLSGSGDLDPEAQFFTTGTAEKIVYVAEGVRDTTAERLGPAATVVAAGDPLDVREVLADLHRRGIGRVMVEGGTSMHTLFLAARAVDEIQLVVAPFFVGDAEAPRFVGPGDLPRHGLTLAEARPMGDHVLLRYTLDGSA
ncbi:RibD family protein [Pseudonocardia sp. TRM90224]|uniref:RibD family protein n=1 Tax=Pseudonocardia sp. TRM90224 TaxID=2812678 RepID=UPI001E31EA25|nr:RibD family protein [Pseudonocardia sp. TRM90224]